MDYDITQLLTTAFDGKQEALEFIKLYSAYANAVDDMIDENFTRDDVEKLSRLASALYTSRYWITHAASLYLLERVIHCNYFTSVEFETSEISWKKEYAKYLAQSGLQIVTAVAIIELGEYAARIIARQVIEKTLLKNEAD